MARPQKNNLDYFPHDNSMRNDRKIKALRSKFDLDGYAIYNMLLEILCESELLIIEWNEIEIELISGDLNIVSDKLIAVSDYLIQIGLIKLSNGYLFCPELDRRSINVFGKRTKDLNSLRIGNGINVSETIVLEKKTTGKKTETTQSKVKDSKVKEIISKDENCISPIERLENDYPSKLESLKMKYSDFDLDHFIEQWNLSVNGDENYNPETVESKHLLSRLTKYLNSVRYSQEKKHQQEKKEIETRPNAGMYKSLDNYDPTNR